MKIVSLVERLEEQLRAIEGLGNEYLDSSAIEKELYDDPFDEPVAIFIHNEYHWAEDSQNQKHLQMRLLRKYSSWFEQFCLLFQGSAQEMQKQIDDTDKAVKKYFEKERGWSVPPTIEEARTNLKGSLGVYYQLLQIFKTSGETKVILVPDTNSLIMVPELSRYSVIAGQTEYTVMIVSTVLSELDKLKRDHRDINFRNKVDSVIKRLKGFRRQGDMREGVTVNKIVTIKMIAQEPDFSKTLSWLDPINNDDRIIAALLEIQKEEPSALVILVTADINHQNKAEAANIPYSEPPEVEKEAEGSI